MEHSFNTMAAQEVGLIPAVLLNHIYFWVTKNKADGCNCYDNQYWTRMSKKGFVPLIIHFMNYFEKGYQSKGW